MNQKFGTNPVRIYALHNTSGYIKIGVTTDFKQRLQSLQESNGGGSKIDRFWVSKPTLLYSLERVMHEYYKENRIEGTEWFENLNFEEVVFKIEQLMNTDSFKRCEETRRQYYKEKASGHVH